MLNVLHTSDWHLGKEFQQFDEAAATRLSRERLSTVENILRLAQRRDIDAVLCAGDLFDTHDPPEAWWRGLADLFRGFPTWTAPVILLPGNHDPLMTGSVYEPTHPFRRQLPEWVKVVDRDNFELPLGDRAVLYATPCCSKAGAPDAAMRLPERAADDDRIRIGMIHGQTWDRSATPFPVSKHAANERRLDYLALGDTHSFEEVMPDEAAPVVYCGTPEPTRFGEDDPGGVVLVRFRRTGVRPRVERVRVGRYVWKQTTVNALHELRNLVDDDLKSTVLRLTGVGPERATADMKTRFQWKISNAPNHSGVVVLSSSAICCFGWNNSSMRHHLDTQ